MTSSQTPAPGTLKTAPRQKPSLGTRPGNRWVLLAGVLALQLLIVALAVAPQLSPRVSGTEIQLRVEPIDPIDPFRGAYAALGYPDLPQPRQDGSVDPDRGTAYVPLSQDGEVWVGGAVQRTEPEGLFLRCSDRSWQIDCGIDSWFAPQDKAYALEQDLRESGAIATVRVDQWGNASIVDLRPATSST